jgi:hypothetical protein
VAAPRNSHELRQRTTAGFYSLHTWRSCRLRTEPKTVSQAPTWQEAWSGASAASELRYRRGATRCLKPTNECWAICRPPAGGPALIRRKIHRAQRKIKCTGPCSVVGRFPCNFVGITLGFRELKSLCACIWTELHLCSIGASFCLTFTRRECTHLHVLPCSEQFEACTPRNHTGNL